MTYTTSFTILQNQAFSINPKDAGGNPAALDGPVTVAVADSSVLRVDGPFGNRYAIVSLTPGHTVITLSATSNSVPLVEDIDVTISPVPAVTLGVVFEAPSPKA